MSSTDLDLPVLVTPDQIRRREFVTTRRGYDVQQVRDYLEQVSRQVEQMDAMLRTAKLNAGEAGGQPVSRVDPYEQLSRRFAEVMRSTDREADRMRREAREEADRVMREARADADRIRLEAQTRAEQAREEADRALREARDQADRSIAGLASRRAALVEQLAAMQERLLGVARELEATIDRPDDAELIASLPTTAADAGVGGQATDIGELAEGGAPGDVDEPPQHTGAASAFAADAAAAWPHDGTEAPDVIDLDHPDATVEELWSAPDPEELRIPEIPALDLDWDDDDTPG
jgi:DivIVA domain-containing protein